jgi:hypothetical protein
MADEISDMAIVPGEVLNITGNCDYKFQYGTMDWLINLYGDRITTENITSANQMFSASKVKHIPFELNMATQKMSMSNLFQGCSYLEDVPKINGKPIPTEIMGIFSGCGNLRSVPEDIADWFDWSSIDTATSAYGGGSRGGSTFYNCHRLRSIPMEFLAHLNPYGTGYSSFYYQLFTACWVLDEIVGLPIPRASDMNWTSNSFPYTFNYCYRLKNMTFATNEDGSPIQVKWKSQTIDLSNTVGYMSYYPSGYSITTDKEVKDDATYQALKNDPDWFTSKVEYSRYNHDSAVATINSLPDTSAFLAETGGSNLISFAGAAGSATDGGAINTLTEEEIAVAAAKGWTVSLE